MKRLVIPRRVLVVAALLAVSALLTGVAVARTGIGAMPDSPGDLSVSVAGDQLDATLLTGGQYQLISISSPMKTLASGGGYRLVSSAPAVDPAPGCCCKSMLPCVLK
jgi:hypothetical protein